MSEKKRILIVDDDTEIRDLLEFDISQSGYFVESAKDGMEALECLQRAFEIAINYCVYSCNEDRRILKLRYDTELLVTGKKARKTLSEKYLEEKSKNQNKTTKATKPKPQYCSVKSKTQEKKRPYFWYFVGVSALVSACMLIILALI